MNNKQQFEAWYLENWGCTEDNHDSLFEESPHGGEYYRFGVRLAWQAWQAASKASEQQLAAVVAENATLKSAINFAEPWLPTCDDELLHRIELTKETPATDAAIANIQAQGVELYADNLDRGADDAERDGFEDGMKFLRAEAESVREFAAKLRQGGDQ